MLKATWKYLNCLLKRVQSSSSNEFLVLPLVIFPANFYDHLDMYFGNITGNSTPKNDVLMTAYQ